MSEAVEKRKLSELRVVDLKQELEKRGKDGNGVKNVLIERLTQALKEENEDPETFEFEIGSVGKTPAKKKAAAASGKSEEESTTSVSNGSGSEPNMSDMQVRDECTDEQQPEADAAAAAKAASETTNGQPEMEVQKISLIIKQEKLDEDEIAQQKAAQNASKEPEKEPAKAAAEAGAGTNGGDKSATPAAEKETENEDSLNLEIGEEDEKLLHDATGEKVTSEKNPDAKSADGGKSVEKGDSSSDKPAATKEDKDAGKSSSSSASKQSGETGKSKSSPGGSGEKSTVSRNLWVSGLSTLTRATDLKLIFSKYGKVIGAKVVTNTRTPGTRCYGYVTMASAKDATECIAHLHRTELHGRMISVERAKSDLGPAKASGGGSTSSNSNSKTTESSSSKTSAVQASDSKKDSKDRDRRDSERRDNDRRHERGRSQHRSDRAKSMARGRSTAREASPNRSRSNHRSKSMARDVRSRSNERKKDDTKPKDNAASTVDNKDKDTRTSSSKDQPQKRTSRDRRDREREVLSLQKIREERERQRLREKERQLREEDRRRREIRQRQREEEQMLRREREKLAIERARIEKEKAELLRIERERQKLEREKIELERLELKRQQRKIEEAKRNMKRPGDHSSSHYDDDRKRSAVSERRFEAPPPPSISSSTRGSYSAVDKPYSSSKRDDYATKRDDYKSTSRDDYKSRGGAIDDYRSGAGGGRDSFKRNGGVMDDYKRTLAPIESRYSDTRSAGGLSGGGGGLGSGDYRGDRDRNGAGGVPKSRYLDSSYPERGSTGGNISSGGMWHSSTGPSLNLGNSLSSGGDTWRMDNGQDRYDRTYNERKAPQMSTAPFLDPPRPSGFMGGSGGRPQDRYGAPVGSGRFDNGRY